MEKKEIMFIDNIPVEINGERNLLELIRKVGIILPTFCYHSELSIYGACRMCMVEDEKGRLEAACSTPPRAGMSIRTNTERLRRYRKVILELLLAHHCRDCTTCASNEKCKLQDLARTFHIAGVRFPNTAAEPKVDDSSLCIVKDQNKCILCGDCVRTCNEVQNVGAIDFAHRGSKMTISTAFGVPLAESPCVGCGQCVAACPTGALMVRNDVSKVSHAIARPDVTVSVQVAPAVRVGLGRACGLQTGEEAMGKIVAALRRLGFDEVYDTSTGADLTVMEESEELLSRLESGENLPLITSCCPGWVQFAEKRYPEFLPNVSTCRSPMQMLAGVVKEQKKGAEKKHVHVAVMPCTAKKFEAARPEFRDENGGPMTDYVLTTEELIRMIDEAGMVFSELEPEAVDSPLHEKSGAGVIFGVTGGVTEAVLRRISEDKTGSSLQRIAFSGVRGFDGLRETTVTYKDREVRIAVVSGLANASRLLDGVKAGTCRYDFIEIMACPGGCVLGGGQPFIHNEEKELRGKGLYKADKVCSIRRSEDNPLMKQLYEGVLKEKRHELLHVHYGRDAE
ncbi:MAG: [FeFe] hydrogenase, group A [Lachnospiraceae bacterium]|nr:[FeFe] hydrogenase, group A [Lachnospiraceae bacterium]